MSILNTTNTPIGISFATASPSRSDNISAGYPLTQEWFNEETGERFFHKADGVWVSYNFSDAEGEVPVMFADLATTATLDPVPAYDNGVDGVGATLTGQSNGALIVDSDQSIDAGAVILVKDQIIDDLFNSISYQNGVYYLTQQGTATQSYILTRTDFCDEIDEVYPSQVNILSGLDNKNKYFLQKAVDPVIGTDAIIYEAKTVIPTPAIILPVVHVDTATTEPLPSCTYANVYAPVIPGQWWNHYPISATLTADANGTLGTINGVLMSDSFLNRNRKILVKNQADARHNGDYVIVQRGSATQPWKLERITKDWGSLDKSVREWKVNNEASSLYGNRYYMTGTFFGRMGISNIEFSEISNGNIARVTYDELVALVSGSYLTPGRTYLLTDYQTTWEDSITGATFSSGVIEPLYITATDVNELNKECKSELYPQDIVYYEVTGDIVNGYGVEGFTKGKIYRRIDTISNNDIGTDWRHVQYRRYAMKVENPWTMGNSYVVGDVVNDGSNIHICIFDIADSQSLTDGNWFVYPATNGEYAGIFESGNTHLILSTSITIPVDANDHQDLYLFNFGNYVPEQIYNNTIESNFLNNTVITSAYFYGNTVKGGFYNNHIKSSQFTYNRFRQFFGYNILGDSTFYYNEILDSFYNNIVVNVTPFRNNEFSGEVTGNVYGVDMTGNEMARMNRNYVTYFSDNVMSNIFSYNALRGNWYYNQCINGRVEYCKSAPGFGVVANVFSYFLNNNIYSDFNNNRMSGEVTVNEFNGTFNGNDISGEEFGGNTFLGSAGRNIIGTSFNSNTIGDVFYNNVIGILFQNNIVGELFQLNNIGAANSNWTFRDNTNRLTILNNIDGTGRNIPYIPGTYDKTIRLSNEVLKCDYVDEYSDIIFQPDNTGPTFTFKSDREDLRLYVENNVFPVSGIPVTPFIVDWGDVLNPLVQDIAASDLFNITHTYSGKLNTDLVEVVMIGKYIRYIELYGNQITEFDLTNNISQYVEYLDLSENLLTYFNPTVALPNSLTYLTLYDNQLTGFDPSIALPGSLLSLQLSLNQITSFNTSIALPSVLQYLYLSYNQLSYFDPSIALPNSLEELYFDNNLLTSFNPTSHSLPSSLVILNLEANQLDTNEVNNTLIMLNTTYTVAGSKTFTLNMSPPATPDGAGLTAKSELQAKGYTVYTD